MPTPDPAERRHIIRGAIECAIGLNTGTPRGQTGSLTAAVWRIIEPALTHRDDQITAIRAHIDAMAQTPELRPWADTLRAALRTRPGPLPPAAWCGASMTGLGADPIGPCVLRAGHDGPVHQAANGAKWWPEQTLTVRDLTPPRLISAQLLEDADPPINLGPLLDTRQFAEIMDDLDPATIAPPPPPPDGAGLYEGIVRLYGAMFPTPPARHPDACACACGGTTTLHASNCPVHPVRLRAIEDRLTALLPDEARAAGLHLAYDTTPDQCRAEYHRPGYPDARCDLPGGHTDFHRDQTRPGGTFRWDDSVAMYPTTPEDDQ
jgi:hypothetical protein